MEWITMGYDDHDGVMYISCTFVFEVVIRDRACEVSPKPIG